MKLEAEVIKQGGPLRIERILLLHESKNLIILYVDVNTKWPRVTGFSGDDESQSVWINDDNEILLRNVPSGWKIHPSVGKDYVHLFITPLAHVEVIDTLWESGAE